MRWLAVAALVFAGVANGASLYVNNSGSPACSDATTKAANTAAAPWCTIGRAAWGNAARASADTAQAAAAGDTVYITAGTYSAPGTDDRKDPAFQPVNAGSSGNQITFVGVGTVYLQLSSGTGPVIGYYSSPGTAGYTTWRNFTINEANATHAPDTGNAVIWTSPGNVIEQVTFNGVGETNTDPPQCNHSAIRIEGTGTIGNTIRNNTIYNYKSDGCGEWNINGAGILLYFADGTIIENNTIHLAGTGIYVKGADHINTTIRKNLIYDTQIAIAYQYTGASGNNYITQNIIRCEGTPAPEKYGIWVRNDTENIWIVNNTVVGCESAGIGYGKEYTPEPTGTYVYNNIVYQSAGNNWGNVSNVSLTPITADYNLYYSATRFAVTGTQTTLADWRTALGGCPNAGNDCSATSADPLFVNAGTYDYHLQGGSPALTLGVDVLDYDSDTNTTETIPAGAYITGSETIGAGTTTLSAPGRPRWRPLVWWAYLLYAGALH